jgi:hypothetical protein
MSPGRVVRQVLNPAGGTSEQHRRATAQIGATTASGLVARYRFHSPCEALKFA